MIARNFVKYPEALRFQREMFSNGYHNSPRIMRLMECVFDWSATVPDWWKEAKGRARDLARRVKKSIGDFFKESNVIQMTLGFWAPVGMTLELPKPVTVNTVTEMLMKQVTMTVYRHSGPHLPTPDLDPYWNSFTHAWALQAEGEYRWFCPQAMNKRLWVSYGGND